MIRSLLLTAAFGLGFAGTASAAVVVLQDDFNYGSDDRLNIPSDFLAPLWSAGPTIDYIITDNYGELCRDATNASGCIDLDGSTNNPGLLQSIETFAAGTYSLAITLFGSGRDTYGDDEVVITLGDWSETLSNIAFNDDVSGVFTFTTTTSGQLSFQNDGGNNVGAVLSSVTLSAVPLPAGGLLLLGALGGFAALRRRKTA